MRRILVSVLFLLLLTSCQARTNVAVNVEPNGSGSVDVVVILDEQAAAAVPNLEADLKTSDLTQAGWDVDVSADDGETVVRARHGFDSAAEANALMRQLGGPFKDFDLSVDRSFTNTKTTFNGVIDLTQGINAFGDTTLQQRVGSPLGFDVSEMQQSLGLDYPKLFPVEVTVDLPGSKTTAAGEYGAAKPITVSSSGSNYLPAVLLGLALASAVAALVVAIVWKSGKYQPAHRKKKGSVRARDLLKD